MALLLLKNCGISRKERLQGKEPKAKAITFLISQKFHKSTSFSGLYGGWGPRSEKPTCPALPIQLTLGSYYPHSHVSVISDN